MFALAATPTLIVGSAMLMSFALLGAWGGLYAFTPELYPTEVRATGMGWASAMARAAGILAPTVGGLLLGPRCRWRWGSTPPSSSSPPSPPC